MKITAAAILVMLLSLPAPAQTVRGDVGGRVTGEAAKPVARAMVRLTDLEAGRLRQAETDSRGEFLFTLLAPGDYRLEIQSASYQTQVRQFTLLTNQEIRFDIALVTGLVPQRVDVTATRSLMKTDSAGLGSVLDNHLVRGLPLDGRNFLELALLLPGVAPAAEGSASSVRGDLAFHVNGSREDSNNYQLDGVYAGDPKLNGYAGTSSVDSIREFEVLASAYDASFGRNAGGQVSVILRSGGNQWHGAAYEFLRNAALDARNFFAPATEPDPSYRRNQFGFTLGGPVVRNKTFLFGGYEGLRLSEGLTRITNVPTAAERQGDFSRSAAPPFDPISGQPFPNGRIPPQWIHQTGSALAALYPLPNRDVGGQNYVSSPAIEDRRDHFDIRFDQGIGHSGELSARWSFADQTRFNPFAGPTFASVPGYGVETPRRAQNGMVSEIHAFSPSLVNEVRVAFNRVAADSLHENLGRSINTEVGLPELSANPRDHGLSLVTLPGYSALGDETNNPQRSVTNTYQVLDHLTLVRGRHLVKFGGEFRRTQQNAYRDVQARGFLNFLGITGNPLADLLLGYPAATGGATLDNPQYLRTWSGAYFVNDTWRIHPSVTVSAGLRYEYNSPPVDKYDRANIYDPELRTLVPVGTNGVPRSGYLPDRNNWGPRIGIAWKPKGVSSTIVRAGYGLYFDQSALAPGEGLYFNPPYFNFRLFFPLPGMPLTLSDPFPSNFPFPWPASALSYQRDLRSPYVQHWNFGIQRQVGGHGVFEIAYAGSKGTKQLTARDINQAYPSAVMPNPRPVPQFADINSLESRGNSNYHSLQARFQQYLSRGVALLASYTFSKSIDDASSFFSSAGDASFPQDSYNVQPERGRSNFDVRQRLTLSYSWELPFGRGKRYLSTGGAAATVFGDWQTFGLWTFQTGRPFTPSLVPELDNSNTGRSILGFGANDRPNLVGNPAVADPSPESWFTPSAFAIPAFGTFGNSGRNILDGPGLQTVNVSLLRDFPITERTSLQFRAEAFNLLNRANFNLPDIFLGSPTFGRILSAQSPRRIQFGLKLMF